jgi:hypothetical protein
MHKKNSCGEQELIKSVWRESERARALHHRHQFILTIFFIIDDNFSPLGEWNECISTFFIPKAHIRAQH